MGQYQIQFHVDEGMIQDVNVFSDAMDQEMIGMLAEQLKGCAYAEEDMQGGKSRGNGRVSGRGIYGRG